MKPLEILKPVIRQDWASGPTDGLQLQFSASIDGLVHIIAAIVADEANEALWFEVYVHGKAIRIPLADVASAIEAAPNRVHSTVSPARDA